MSIVENMQMDAYLRTDTDGIKKDVDRMFGFFPRLKERATQYAGMLSGGEQQMLAMARAIISKPMPGTAVQKARRAEEIRSPAAM
jgi:branched-chain amino acid transport system ATP-binding protein